MMERKVAMCPDRVCGYSTALVSGGTFLKYCPECRKRGRTIALTVCAMPLVMADLPIEAIPRLPTPWAALTAQLGEGWALGSVVLVHGPGGVGKSTFGLQAVGMLGGFGAYISGEMPADLLGPMVLRLGLTVAGETRVAFLAPQSGQDGLAGAIASLGLSERRADLIVVDSLQAVGTDSIHEFRGFARGYQNTWIILCHETKAGDFQGPNEIEHEVDVVIRLSPQWTEENDQPFLRVDVTKNRMGPCGVLRLSLTEMGIVSWTGDKW